MNLDFKKTLVIAPHLDDETIALGGTIKKLSKTKSQINVIIVGGHLPPLYQKEDYQITKNESKKALKILGVKKVYYLDIPALEFHRKYYNTLNSKINALMNDFNPTTVFIPFFLEAAIILFSNLLDQPELHNTQSTFFKASFKFENLYFLHFNLKIFFAGPATTNTAFGLF